MEIIEDLQAKSALIVTSQVPITQWYDVIGENTIADAIMDRIIHEAN
jgi:DNA replication protein DnaC